MTTQKRTITSSDLLNDQHEVTIVHNGETYRLRITSNNKLIMTK
jgi:hemin uptake protein HemP